MLWRKMSANFRTYAWPSSNLGHPMTTGRPRKIRRWNSSQANGTQSATKKRSALRSGDAVGEIRCNWIGQSLSGQRHPQATLPGIRPSVNL